MNKLFKKKTIFIVRVIVLLLYASVIYGTELPPNWPWRGVVVHSCCGDVNTNDVATLSSYGVNAIVLNIKSRFRAQTLNERPQIAWEESLKWVDKMLDACKDHGLVGIIRLTKLPLDPKSGIREFSPEFWDENMRWKEATKLAGILAQRYSKRGEELGAYAILTEPTLRVKNKVSKPPKWNYVQREIINAIRQYDKKRFIVATAAPAGLPQNYSHFNPINDKAIIYGVHMYAPHSYTHQGIKGRSEDIDYPGLVNWQYWNKERLNNQLKKLHTFQIKYNALVWIGEFGVVRYAPGAETYLQDLINIFNTYKFAWTYFSFKGNPLWDFREVINEKKGWPKNVRKAAAIHNSKTFETLKNAWKKPFLLPSR